MAWWGHSLAFVLGIYIVRLHFATDPGSTQGGVRYAWLGLEGALSNCANYCVYRMQLDLRQPWFTVSGRRSKAWWFILICAPLAIGLGFSGLSRWFPTSPELARLVITTASAIPSFLALVSLGNALRDRLHTLRQFTRDVFLMYGVTQLAAPVLSGMLLFDAHAPPTLAIASSVCVGLGIIFKVACTMLVMSAGSEVANRRTSDLLAYELNEAGNASLIHQLDGSAFRSANPITGNACIVVGHRVESISAVSKMLESSGFVVFSYSKPAAELIGTLPMARFGVILIEHAISTPANGWILDIARNLASQYKEWVVVAEEKPSNVRLDYINRDCYYVQNVRREAPGIVRQWLARKRMLLDERAMPTPYFALSKAAGAETVRGFTR
jgi:hypothetical protein